MWRPSTYKLLLMLNLYKMLSGWGKTQLAMHSYVVKYVPPDEPHGFGNN